MSNPNRPLSWTVIDEEDVKNLIIATGGPGGVFKVPVSNLPKNLQKISGIDTYYASAYGDPQDLPPNLRLFGEMALGRIDGDLAKYYAFVYAKSDEGEWRFAGPCKDFPLHHVASGSPIQIDQLFGRHPFATRK